MRTNRVVLGFFIVSLVLVGLAGCSNDSKTPDATSALRSGSLESLEDGFTLAADPAAVVIDLDDPATPVDSSNDKHYAETALTALALDELGMPQEGLAVTFQTTAGALASLGQPVNTEGTGAAHDTLRVFEDDPAEITVTATAGERSETIVVQLSVLQPNDPPVADAGDDVTIECTSSEGTAVRLDGSGSTDPNSDIVLYEWFLDFGLTTETKLGEGTPFDTTLDVGVHTITLRVTDSRGETSTDEVVVTIEDTTPPEIEVVLDPSTLWPPNHKLVHVTAHVTVIDCSPTTVVLTSLESSEPANANGDGNTEPDILGAAVGTADYEFDLRSERAGGGHGRTYSVVYTATDEFGNAAEGAAEVRAPHDQGH